MNETTTNQGGKKVKASKTNKVTNLPYEIRAGFKYILEFGSESKFDIARAVVSKQHHEDGVRVIQCIEAAREFLRENSQP